LSKEECLALLKKQAGSELIEKHSIAVARLAVFLAKKLVERGIIVDVGLVEKAALLHDIDKLQTLDGREHGKKSAMILKQNGLSKIARIVEKHNLDRVLKGGDEGLASWEEKLVYYADKRANLDKIVTLDERFEYLFERYGSKHPKVLEKIKKCKPRVERLEAEILEAAGLEKDFALP
jgi:putative nucleotidyltransferase with HDIG domain